MHTKFNANIWQTYMYSDMLYVKLLCILYLVSINKTDDGKVLHLLCAMEYTTIRDF